MPFGWNNLNSGTTSREPAKSTDSNGLSIIPLWSVALAIVIFVGVQLVMDSAPPAHRTPGSLPMHLIFGYTTATALASYFLLVGYVSRDVKRRGMSAPLWILITLIMPGGIGAVVYFLLRQPMLTKCPNCTTELEASVHFCPQCQFQVAPVCGQCFRGVRITDQYCAQCGHELGEDNVPARLRVYRDS